MYFCVFLTNMAKILSKVWRYVKIFYIDEQIKVKGEQNVTP